MGSKKQIRKSDTAKSTKQKLAVDTKVIKNVSYIFLALAAIVLIIYCKSFDFVQDDSFITFRYVKNFTEGHGLVFNIGDRVEGYTCFLWVMFLSAIKFLGINFISASQTFGMLFGVLTLYFTYRISVYIFPKNRDNMYNVIFGLISIVLLISNGAFAYWIVSGMETAMFTFLVTFGVFLYLKEIKSSDNKFPFSSIVLLFASMTRPEGNLVFAVTILHKIIFMLRKPGGKVTETVKSPAKILLTKKNLIWVGLYIVPAIIFMLWRYSYYGFLFPNTFYAKTGSTLEYFKTGLDYFVDFAVQYGFYGVLVAIIFINLRKTEKFYEHLYLLMIFVFFSLYIIYVGGDVLRPARFFVPIMPIFYLLVQEAADTILTFNPKKMATNSVVYLVAIILFIFSYLTYSRYFDQIKKYSELENGLVEKMKLSAGWLKNKSITEKRTLTVAATTIGAISYYSDVNLIDMLGLTDKEIAHHPNLIPEISANAEIGWKERHYNVDYVISRKPDYIYFSTGLKPSAYAERGLFTNNEFLKYYFPSYFSIKDAQFTDCIYKRKTDEEVKQIKELPPNPKYEKSFVNLLNQAMNTQRDKSKSQEALSLYQQTITVAPSNFGIPYELMGDIYLQNKMRDKGIEDYKKAIEIDDYCIMAHYSLYQYYISSKDTVEAQKQLDKILRYSPDMLK